MSITREELIVWATTTPPNCHIGIDEGGIMLVTVENGAVYLEIGGVPDGESCQCGGVVEVGCEAAGRVPTDMRVLLKSGETVTLPVERIFCSFGVKFAVHHSIMNGKPFLKCWSVSEYSMGLQVDTRQYDTAGQAQYNFEANMHGVIANRVREAAKYQKAING
jgi:hypothetical protein